MRCDRSMPTGARRRRSLLLQLQLVMFVDCVSHRATHSTRLLLAAMVVREHISRGDTMRRVTLLVPTACDVDPKLLVLSTVLGSLASALWMSAATSMT